MPLISCSVIRFLSLTTSVSCAPYARIRAPFLIAERIGEHEVCLVATGGRTSGRGRSGRARRVLDHGPARWQPSVGGARSTMARATRSFMLPVGLADSSFAMMRADPAGTTRRSSTSGVLPMASRTCRDVLISSE